jgi:hypothetical protein
MKILREINMAVLECCYCGTTFAVSDAVARKVWKIKARIYCPNGHRIFVEWKGDNKPKT